MKAYQTLEFHLIQNQIKSYCHSEAARDYILNLQPYKDLDDLKEFQDDVAHATSMIYSYGRLPIGEFVDITPMIQKANKGGVLYPQDFLHIVDLLKNIQEIEVYLENEHPASHLLETMNMLYLPKDLYKDINHCIEPSGQIYDHASYELQRIRRQIMSIQANMRKKIESLKFQYKDYLSHDVISTRNDHFVLPVKVSHKNQLKGIQHGHSASGHTMFVEPEEIVVYNNQLATARQDEQLEIHRILLELTKKVKTYTRVLQEDYKIMVDLDILFSIGNYAKRLDMIVPEVGCDYHSLSFIQARHPLINQDDVISNDIQIEKPQDIFLISGSNTGGKTVALKTAGLLSLMAICGLPVPAKEASVPLFDAIYVDLGDEQSIEQSLSTFSSHMKRLVSITESASPHSLIIIDEICSGTDPKEGESLAQAILTHLHVLGCFTFASTHYSALKQYAKESDYIKIASVEFDQERMRPTYRLLEGSVGNSYAIEISRHLGLSEEIIQHASSIKEASLTLSEKLLEKLQNEMSLLEQMKEQVIKEKEEVQKLKNNYEFKIEKYENTKEKLLEEAKEQANALIDESKQKADDILKGLQGNIKPHIAIQAKKELDALHHQKKVQEIHQNHEFQVGDVVRVLSVNREGEILAINKKGILTIGMGGLKLNAKKTEVQFMHEKVKEKKETTNIRSLRKASKQSFELNIIGMRYEEAMNEVDKFLDSALVNNYSMVRIIHGMGTGVLRNGVRKMLDKNKYVKSYQNGGPNEGGLGATLVYFE